jgi:hypothetical protein
MSILFWGKPKKVMTKEQYAESYGFEDGPPGGYSSNMSEKDKDRWKAKLTGTKLGYPQVEIRKSGAVIIVNLGKGYNYKQYRAEDPNYIGLDFESWKDAQARKYPTLGRAWFDAQYSKEQFHHFQRPTEGLCVHIASAGPIIWSMKEYEEFVQAVQEAKEELEKL